MEEWPRYTLKSYYKQTTFSSKALTTFDWTSILIEQVFVMFDQMCNKERIGQQD